MEAAACGWSIGAVWCVRGGPTGDGVVGVGGLGDLAGVGARVFVVDEPHGPCRMVSRRIMPHRPIPRVAGGRWGVGGDAQAPFMNVSLRQWYIYAYTQRHASEHRQCCIRIRAHTSACTHRHSHGHGHAHAHAPNPTMSERLRAAQRLKRPHMAESKPLLLEPGIRGVGNHRGAGAARRLAHQHVRAAGRRCRGQRRKHQKP